MLQATGNCNTMCVFDSCCKQCKQKNKNGYGQLNWFSLFIATQLAVEDGWMVLIERKKNLNTLALYKFIFQA